MSAPEFADEAIIRDLAINVRSLPNGIPAAIMRIVKHQANVYVDSQLSLVYTDWQILKLAPELIPEQAVIAASLIAAGRAENILYAVNTSAGRANQYGMDLEAEGKAMVDDLVNSRMLVLGFYKLDPTAMESPTDQIRWTGGLATQGYLPLKLSADLGVRTTSQSEAEALTNAGYTERVVRPFADWYGGIGFELSYSYNPTWATYVSEVVTDLGRIGATRVKGPYPTSAVPSQSALAQLTITLGQAGIKYLPQITSTSDTAIATQLNALGALIAEVEGPYLTSSGQDSEPQHRQVVDRFHFADFNVSTPQFVGSSPELASMVGVVTWVGFVSTYQPLTPESTSGNLLYYLSRKNFGVNRGIPMMCDIGVDGSGASQASYLMWAMNRVIQDQLVAGLEPGPVMVAEHVDEGVGSFGLRTYSAGSWADKTSMLMLARIKTIFGTTSGVQTTMRIKITGLDDPIITCWKLANGDTVMFLCSGLAVADDPVSVSMLMMVSARVKFYLPTDGVSETDLGVGRSFTFNVSYKPIAILIQAT